LPQAKAVVADAVAHQEGDEQRPDDQDVDVGTDERVEDESCERVNCFPGRPSSAHIVTNKGPTIWFKQLSVVEAFEVSFADLSLSRAHTAGVGIVDDPDGRGIPLPFPRFKRRRSDKSIERAAATEEVAHLIYSESKRSRTSSDVYNPRMPCSLYLRFLLGYASMSTCNDTVCNLQL
jgi:hypothetical protein